MTAKLIVSPKWTLIAEDWYAMGKKALISLAPYALMVIPVLIEKLPAEWIYAGSALWLLNRVKDLFVYLSKETTYRP